MEWCFLTKDMNKIALFLLLFASAPIFAQRLPDSVLPEHYKLGIAPDFNNDSFSGTETIQVRLMKATSTITLNSLELELEEVTVRAGGKSQTATVKLEPANEVAVLSVPQLLPAGQAEIDIKFSGKLNKQLRGLYLSQANNRKYAVTQFEATDARRAFPSFDEPAMKATFDITLVVDKGDTAISNTKVASDLPGPGPGKHSIKFATTPK